MTELLALAGIVVVLSALASGFFERHGISLVLLFLLVGLAVGPYGFGVADYDLASRYLQLVSVVSLTMVLFADAVSLSPGQLRKHAGLAALILGPGTLLSAAIIAFAAWRLLGFSAPGSAMLGAALASTDPVLLRSVLRNARVPEAVRQGLRLESGLNDAVLLPIILIAIASSIEGEQTLAVITGVAAKLLVLGPLIGALVGLVCVLALDAVRKRFGMRRDYESLYTLGVALTAFAAAEVLHTSGYLAAFAAGLAIAFRDVELCDCFHDYGEATAEAALLLTFVALGGSLIWTGLALVDVAHIAFVASALATRPLVLLLVLRRFAVCSLVVLVSVVLHGASPALLARQVREDREDRISLAALDELRAAGRRVHVLDARKQADFDADPRLAQDAVRVNPDYVVAEVRRLGLPKDAWLALYCT
ncbi:MAG: cation:proton antiporter domain-containing protein [Gemmatimonadota bacterium]